MNSITRAAMLLALLAGCAPRPRSYTTTDELFASGIFPVPEEFRRGTASPQDVHAWSASLLDWNDSADYPPLESMKLDVDGDGVAELFVSQPAHAGNGGNVYLAFQQAHRGFRYLGRLAFGRVRPAAPDSSGRARVVTSWGMGGGQLEVGLQVLTPEGFREVATCTLLGGGDSGTAEGNRLRNLLFEAPLTDDVLRVLFSPKPEVRCDSGFPSRSLTRGRREWRKGQGRIQRR